MPHDDYHVEPVRGLPECPPAGEHILWQGAPAVWPLARHAMNAHWVAGYFGLLALWRGLAIGADEGVLPGLTAASWYLSVGLVAVGLLALMAWILARATVYTLTTDRVAMRIGAALTVTLNLPYRWIERADLSLHRDGTGTIALDLRGDTRFSYLVLWPHVRPWRIGHPQPALRCIRDPRDVADLLARHAAARLTEAADTAVLPGDAIAPHPIAAE